MRVIKCKPDEVVVAPNDLVKVKKTGNVTEVSFSDRRNTQRTMWRIDKEHYVLVSEVGALTGSEEMVNVDGQHYLMRPETGEVLGEVKDIQHNDSRADDMRSVAKSIAALRDLINCNVTEPKNGKWITGTYRQREDMDSEPVPMTDTVRLYKDFEKFMKKLRYRYSDYQLEYIVAMEPQGSGSWHFHLILLFDSEAPYMPNDEVAKMWGQGFTTTKALDDKVDNLGAYLSAYLGDMSLDEFAKSGLLVGGEETKEANGKKYVKGGRLRLYPPGFNLYRSSRGIKRPDVKYCKWSKAEKEVKEHTLTFEKSRIIVDDSSGYRNNLNYKYYNSKRKET